MLGKLSCRPASSTLILVAGHFHGHYAELNIHLVSARLLFSRSTAAGQGPARPRQQMVIVNLQPHSYFAELRQALLCRKTFRKIFAERSAARSSWMLGSFVLESEHNAAGVELLSLNWISWVHSVYHNETAIDTPPMHHFALAARSRESVTCLVGCSHIHPEDEMRLAAAGAAFARRTPPINVTCPISRASL